MKAIECGFCGQPTFDEGLCPHCDHDPVLPWFQRAKEPPSVSWEAAEATAEAVRREREAAEIKRTLAAQKRQRDAEAELRRLQAESEGRTDTAPSEPKRRPGRPKGRTIPKDRLIATFRQLRDGNNGKNPTKQELADNLDHGIGLRTLDAHLRDYKLGWPIE